MSTVATKVERKLFGSEVLRLEDPRLLRGEGQYLADIRLYGMVEVAFVRSSVAHARIRGIDIADALAVDGVLGVVTAGELPAWPGMPTLIPLPEYQPFLHPVLAVDEVCYVGQPVAVVIATSRQIAEEAAERVLVDYEELDAVIDTRKAIEPGAPRVHSAIESNAVDTESFAVGDIGALDTAPRRLSRRLSIQRQAGVPLETRGVVAEWDARIGKSRVWTSTQGPHQIQGCVAAYMKLDPHQVEVIVPDVGGAFGTKFNLYPEEVLIPFLARMFRRPIRWIEDRSEHMAGSTHGREQFHEVEIGFEEDGTIVALRDRLLTTIGAYAGFLAPEEAALTMTMMRGPYRIPNFEATTTRVVTNTTSLNPFRAVGQSQAAFVMERMVDEVVRELGLDPVEVRLRNMITAEEMPSDRGMVDMMTGPIIYESGDFPRSLEMAMEIGEYEGLVVEREAARLEGRHLGIGIGSYVEVTSIGPFETARVRIEPSGAVVVGLGTTGSGQGHATTFAQIAADELQVPIEAVTVVAGDTDLVSSGMGAYASRSSAACGTAVRRAATKVRRKALRVAADVLETSSENLELADGSVRTVGAPDAALSLAEVAAHVAPGAPLPKGVDEHGLDVVEHFVPPAASYAYGTQLAAVEVDAETGLIDLRLMVMVHDAGRMINPMLVRGQMHGGMVLGIGTALLEEVAYSADGQPTTTFMDYLLPDYATIPEIRVGHIETPTPHNPDGIKGVGEAGVIAAPAAIVNAVCDALAPSGVSLFDMPLTVERVLKAIRDPWRPRI
ncbi:MAG TPA: xanthine dehydrogenase family protein molybdopterin-binding subunit [Solirubrobacterales bacterium]|jgi:carbon-monoxide dehydrogenase large subunit